MACSLLACSPTACSALVCSADDASRKGRGSNQPVSFKCCICTANRFTTRADLCGECFFAGQDSPSCKFAGADEFGELAADLRVLRFIRSFFEFYVEFRHSLMF